MELSRPFLHRMESVCGIVPAVSLQWSRVRLSWLMCQSIQPLVALYGNVPTLFPRRVDNNSCVLVVRRCLCSIFYYCSHCLSPDCCPSVTFGVSIHAFSSLCPLFSPERVQGSDGPQEAFTALCVLHFVLTQQTVLMAPFTPFFAEHLYLNLRLALPEKERLQVILG
jgi:hypothetical protein